MQNTSAGIPDDDDGMVETVSSNLILVEGDEDELSGSGEDRNNEEQVTFYRRQKEVSAAEPCFWLACTAGDLREGVWKSEWGWNSLAVGQ